MAANATGEAESSPLRLQFDCSVKLAFRGSSISSDGGLLLHRELDDALGLTDMAVGLIADPRTGKNGRNRLVGFLRQSVFSRLAGCEDVNDADRLCRDPVMRQIIGGRAVKHGAASASAMGRIRLKGICNLIRWGDRVIRAGPKPGWLSVRTACSTQESRKWLGGYRVWSALAGAGSTNR